MLPFSTEKPRQSTSSTRQWVVLINLFILFIWQAPYMFNLHQTTDNEESDLGSDGACSLMPGNNGYSTLCMEARLFKGWEEMPSETSAELESLLAISPNKVEHDASSAAPGPSSTVSGLRGDVTRRTAPGGSEASHEPKTQSDPKQSAFVSKQREPKHNKKLDNLADLQKELDAKIHLQARRHAEHRAVRALSKAAQAESQEPQESTTKSLTPWAEGLLHDMHEIEDHMKHWRQERADHAAAFATAFQTAPASQVEEDMMTPFAHKIDDLTHDIQHHMEQRTKERAEHDAARRVAHDARIAAVHANAIKEAPKDITSPLLQEIETLGAQLCQDAKRRNTPGCLHFLQSGTQLEPNATDERAVSWDADAHRKVLEKHMEQLHKDREHDDAEIRQQSEAFLRELCVDPARKQDPKCAHASATTTIAPVRQNSNLRATAKTEQATSVPNAPKLVEYPTALQWAPLTDSEVSRISRQMSKMGESVVSMNRKQLLGHNWLGKIPKVACITVLPEGKVTESLMKYFMDNYKLQHYEGARELVLVYHRSDAQAARIAHLYADGTSVKVAVAHGGGVYPSAHAYRYGAWIARDADLVTRWDFEGFHHPNRLSMQVHAIALSKRPVSLLSGVTAFDANEKHAVVSNTGTHHGSIMGDAAWMRKNWMPIVDEENSLLHGLHSGDVTQVAMPELLSYHDASMFRK